MKQALESPSSIGEVDVTRYQNNNGHNYVIIFISVLGNREQFTVDESPFFWVQMPAQGWQPSSRAPDLSTAALL
jgi:hypothetical protein